MTKGTFSHVDKLGRSEYLSVIMALDTRSTYHLKKGVYSKRKEFSSKEIG